MEKQQTPDLADTALDAEDHGPWGAANAERDATVPLPILQQAAQSLWAR